MARGRTTSQTCIPLLQAILNPISTVQTAMIFYVHHATSLQAAAQIRACPVMVGNSLTISQTEIKETLDWLLEITFYRNCESQLTQ